MSYNSGKKWLKKNAKKVMTISLVSTSEKIIAGKDGSLMSIQEGFGVKEDQVRAIRSERNSQSTIVVVLKDGQIFAVNGTSEEFTSESVSHLHNMDFINNILVEDLWKGDEFAFVQFLNNKKK